MTQVSVIDIGPREKEALRVVLEMYLEMERQDCEYIEDTVATGKFSGHIYYQLKTLEGLYDRIK